MDKAAYHVTNYLSSRRTNNKPFFLLAASIVIQKFNNTPFVQAMAILRGCKGFGAKDLAVPFVYFGITYLAYSSQFCFHFLPPGPLNRTEAVWFNISLLCLWWTYYQARNVDPGRKGWVNKIALKDGKEKNESGKLGNGIRWCKKCEAVKPPRAHHCKTCRR